MPAHLPSSTHKIPRHTHGTCKLNPTRLACILVLNLALLLSYRFFLAQQHGRHTHVIDASQRVIRIEGRWQAVRSSLGLPPLPETVTISTHNQKQTAPSFNQNILPTYSPAPKRASRFDLRRKRSEAELQRARWQTSPTLHFSPDATQDLAVSMDEIAKSFRNIALAEKEIAGERLRMMRLERGLGHTRSRRWSSRVIKKSEEG
ncbi:hypothetical protein SERLA73DRAFT_76237 [Serpula lacrymans var. lacrymans S7.3]|uniref:Uncharacterized protein n=2 Tax=Serpula lacrymans var. lacrymans TaxID=341189 RepID=F8Q6L9_SERL3|nr:uncharacterized protein SERLADRAFT_441029 [Serpula lacrymans var. lacrymans S7.9]EGN96257.1 hypothetical protein SERLA73DRAFT_76237 [Serpula lacrymans var. lacrymans S7.3]EGO21796.1 hypothetical protein SERLADRAFT_441029 [Serpula lacrymans var. lacrymans S7.9]